MMDDVRERFWELDLLRGAFLLLMIFYHLVFDLYWWGGLKVGLDDPWLLALRMVITIGFISTAGASLSLSRFRNRGKQGFKGHLLRGGMIFALGMGITAVSFIIIPESPIYFGILHCIGLSIILAYPFLKLRFTNLILGAVLCAAGLALRGPRFAFPWLLWLGLRPEGFNTSDYFPLLPWFGVVLLGMFAGDMFYSGYKRRVNLPDLADKIPIKAMTFFGRHTLFIYLVHQPVLVGILHLTGFIDLGL